MYIYINIYGKILLLPPEVVNCYNFLAKGRSNRNILVVSWSMLVKIVKAVGYITDQCYNNVLTERREHTLRE